MSPRTVAVLVLALVTAGAGVLAAPSGARGASVSEPSERRPVVAVIGDSISSVGPRGRYGDGYDGSPADRPLVWWSHLVHPAGVQQHDVLDLALGGTGYLRRSDRRVDGSYGRCAGPTFIERLEAVRRARPRIIVLAGGRNDIYRCTAEGTRRATAQERHRAVARFYAELVDVVDDIGVPRTQVFVLVPWGSAVPAGRAEVVDQVETAARAARFTYVAVPPSHWTQQLDVTHPDEAGGRRLADVVARGSSLDESLAAAVQDQPVPAPSPARAASRSTTCSTAERRATSRGGWGRSGAAGLVSARLSAVSATPMAPPQTSESWWRAARRAGGRPVNAPRAGDVAWWPGSAAVMGPPREHVAVVRSVADGATTVSVTEAASPTRCYRTVYTAGALPSVYIRMPRDSGTPRGAVTSVVTSRRSLRLTGWAVDPDASLAATRVRITVRGRSGRVVTRRTSRVPFVFRLHLDLARSGVGRGARVTVVTEALNRRGTHGRAHRRVDSRSVRLR